MQVPELKQRRGRTAGTETLAKFRVKRAEQTRVGQKPRFLSQLVLRIDEERQGSFLQRRAFHRFRQVQILRAGAPSG
jgi:hypothetical protein